MSGAVLDIYEQVRERKSYFPGMYTGTAPSFIGTAARSDQPEAYFRSGRFNSAPLIEFKGEQKTYVTSKPILIKVYRQEDIFFAENESLVLCGTGASREEAVLDFVKHVDYFYNFYKRQSEGNLVGDALRLKKIYDELLVEV